MAARKYKRRAACGYQYIQKDSEWLESPAYRDLRPLARCLLEEFLIVYRPTRNGKLSLPTKRAAARLGVTENTILSAYDDLIEHGFLVLVSSEQWVERMAREWRLTMMPSGNREPSDDWKRWEADQPVRRTRRRKNSRSKKLQQAALKNGAASPEKLQQNSERPTVEITPWR